MDHGSPADRLREYVVRSLIQDEDIELEFDEPIFSSGLLDSFSVTRLICHLEDEFATSVPTGAVTLEDFDTISSCLALVGRLKANPVS